MPSGWGCPRVMGNETLEIYRKEEGARRLLIKREYCEGNHTEKETLTKENKWCENKTNEEKQGRVLLDECEDEHTAKHQKPHKEVCATGGVEMRVCLLHKECNKRAMRWDRVHSLNILDQTSDWLVLGGWLLDKGAVSGLRRELQWWLKVFK